MFRLFSAATRKSVLTLTDRAVSRIQVMLLDQPSEVIGIRLSLKKRGCSGLSYSMDYTTEIKKFDEVVQVGGKSLVIDSKAVMFVLGTTMDYTWSHLSEEFTFMNPNATGQCGCGESFMV